jgi:hypothetical protein
MDSPVDQQDAVDGEERASKEIDVDDRGKFSRERKRKF